jgi:hypothetical protein
VGKFSNIICISIYVGIKVVGQSQRTSLQGLGEQFHYVVRQLLFGDYGKAIHVRIIPTGLFYKNNSNMARFLNIGSCLLPPNKKALPSTDGLGRGRRAVSA